MPSRRAQSSSAASAASRSSGPALQPQLLEVGPGAPDHRARRHPEQRHDRVAVQVRPHPGQVLRRRDLGDPRFQVVVGALQRPAPVRVAGRAIRADQLVQPGQQLGGVGDVPAHRGIGPLAGPVTVKAQVQVGQRGNVVDQRLRHAQLAQPLADQLGTDHLVMMEAHPGTGLEPAGRRFADVVQQRRQPEGEVRAVGLLGDRLIQHRQGVLVHVLVLKVLVPLQPQRRQLRQHPIGQPGVGEQRETGPRIVTHDQLHQLGTDPLRGDPVDFRCHLRHRGDHPRRRHEGELRHEPSGPEHPQRVVPERLLGGRRSVQDPGAQLLEPAERVGELMAGQRHRHRVHREVPALQVTDQAVAEGDHRVPAVPVVQVRPERGDLQPQTGLGDADRAEVDPGVPGRLAPPGHQLLDLRGAGVGGEVEIVTEPVEQRVAHRTADEVQLVAGRGEFRDQARRPPGRSGARRSPPPVVAC